MSSVATMPLHREAAGRDRTSYHPDVPKRAATSVWISIDMEGIGGVATYSHVMMQGIEYERARQWMTHEANACIEGASSAGARRVCVNDSHGAMHNIFADDLDPRAELVVGTAKPWSMGQAIDGGYDTCFFVGYHGRAGHPKAVLDHTYASRAIYECRLNRKPVGETRSTPTSPVTSAPRCRSSRAMTRRVVRDARSCPTSLP